MTDAKDSQRISAKEESGKSVFTVEVGVIDVLFPRDQQVYGDSLVLKMGSIYLRPFQEQQLDAHTTSGYVEIL